MRLNSMDQNIQTVSFVEMVVVKSAQTSNPDFDIILDDEITLQIYCDALINKLFELPHSEYPTFINYQSAQVKEVLIWINKLEELISNNEEIFILKRALCRYHKLLNLIDQKRKEVQSSSIKEIKLNTPKKYINAENEDRYFSFYELKKQLDNTSCDNEKILLLTKEQYEYQQTNIDFINQKTPNYDEQCRKEIEQIYALRKLKAELELAKPTVNPNQSPFNKMRFNGNLNQLVDIFYQLNRELFVDGKSYIDGNTNDLITIIVNSFVDKEGKEISPLTVKTILKPSKEEKRPNTHKRIDIEKYL